ncbi:unnamed protein product [Allacma fusca]|uniref:Uncharacterized protein n=1 Tax=Allacma fusca TaxID=39272 RepID=A0A8J2KKR2_9HEXA|nr:unnamed protein product [Allacma fusca]
MKLHTACIFVLVCATVFTVDARRRRTRPTGTPRPVGTEVFPQPGRDNIRPGVAYPKPTRSPPVNLSPVEEPSRPATGGAYPAIRPGPPMLEEPSRSRGPNVDWFPTLEI